MVQAPGSTTTAPQSAVKSKQPQMILPFPIAATAKTSLGFTTNNVVMSTTANSNLGPIEIPATGFLRYITLLIVGTTASNAATVVFAPDAPFNAIAYLTLTNSSGDSIIVPIDGYMLYLINKWGAIEFNPPFADPRNPAGSFVQTAGVGAGLGGSFAFNLKIPLEIDPETAFGSIPSMASNKSLQLGLQIAPTSVVYTTAPTTPPTVTVTGLQDYWAQPNADNGRGVQQATQPDGNNSVMIWRLDTPTMSAGDKTYKFANIGNVIRMALMVYRNASFARSDALIPALHQLVLNNDTIRYKPDSVWIEDLVQAYGYDVAGRDAYKALDTGVRPIHYWMLSNGAIEASAPRNQVQPTLDTTLLNYRATSFGTGMTTLQVLTCEIKPTDAAALYQRT